VRAIEWWLSREGELRRRAVVTGGGEETEDKGKTRTTMRCFIDEANQREGATEGRPSHAEVAADGRGRTWKRLEGRWQRREVAACGW
jgi:hypothetical protein